MTLQQASNYLREPDRELRKEAFLKIRERRYADAGTLTTWDKLGRSEPASRRTPALPTTGN